MLTNEIFALLKSARGLAQSFLKSRSPENLAFAIRELRTLVDKAAYAAQTVDYGDLPPQAVIFTIDELRQKAALVQGDVCSNRDDLLVAKSITPGEFYAHVAEELAKAASLPTLEALDAGYSLLKRIDKATEAFGKFGTQPAEMSTFVFYKQDAQEAASVKKATEEALAKGEKAPEPGPWSPAPVAKEGEAAPEPPPAPDVNAEIAKARAVVEKSRTSMRIHGGWGMDMNTPRFRDGAAPLEDFGPDPKRS